MNLRALTISFIALSLPAMADSISDYERLTTITSHVIREIAETSVVVCTAAEQAGYQQTSSVTEAADAKTGVLASLLASLSVSTVRKKDEQQWKGVLQDQLAESIKHTNECRYDFNVTTQKLVLSPLAEYRTALHVSTPAEYQGTTAPSTSAKAIVRVFPKDNITAQNITLLQAKLPEYQILQGSSAIDKIHPADVLIVNFDHVAVSEIIEVASALREMGVSIKSVQQSVIFARNELQVGTSVDPQTGLGLFSGKEPLNLAALARLQGAAFWRAATNGVVLCNTEVGFSHFCGLDSAGRAVISH